MTVLYIASKILTFPGAYVKAFWEHLTCKLLGLPVESEGYIRFDEACGHVEHAFIRKGWPAYLVATGPGFMNFNIGLWFFLAGFFNLRFIEIKPSDSMAIFVVSVVAVYIGISMLCNVFPLVDDAMNLFDLLYKRKKGNIIGRIFGFIPAVIVYVGAFLEKYCITVIIWAVAMVLAFVL